MKPDNAMVGRHVVILLAGIPTIECKVSSLFEDEIIANYADGEEVHISMAHVAAWWFDKKSHAPKKRKAEQ